MRGLVRNIVNQLFDKFYHLDSTSHVELEEMGLGHQERVHYAPSGWLTMPRLSKHIPFSTSDTFVDFGSGKGRVLIMAALHYPFKRIVGVEISPELNAITQNNIEKNIKRLKCKHIELVSSDALKFEIPEDMTIAYFYSPFTGAIFKGVLENIRRSLERRKNKRMWIVLQTVGNSGRAAEFNECKELLANSPWLESTKSINLSSTLSINIFQSIDTEVIL